METSPDFAWRHRYEEASAAAASAKLDRCVQLCDSALADYPTDRLALLTFGALLLGHGLVGRARSLFERCLQLGPDNPVATLNLANAQLSIGEVDAALEGYARLLPQARPPLSYRIASNYLTALQYRPDLDDATLRRTAEHIGRQYGEAAPCPSRTASSRLRLGFVSADLCDHPVGLFLLPLLRHLDRSRFEVLLFANGGRDDTTASELRQLGEWQDIAELSHDEVVHHIRSREVDVLFDLSGHTAGNRLPVFASRAAPVQASWLGYFATTGVPAMDVVVMDPWHAPPGTEDLFSERLVRIPASRFCYQPVSFAPPVTSAPCLSRGHVTFGSFNNTSKINDRVINAWAEILRRLPDSRLVLKWRTYADPNFRSEIHAKFAASGIDPARVELRGQSFHKDLLAEYGDVDIALDPFPFSGGLTSCEALWMGVPVISLPGGRPVSRQTLCFLANIGLAELAASNEADYVDKAVALAEDHHRLSELRAAMRERIRCSPLMDALGFARDFEAMVEALVNHQRPSPAPSGASHSKEPEMSLKQVLHVGCGPATLEQMPALFRDGSWKEVRLDIDPKVKPDIEASICDMAPVPPESFAALYSSHNLEHLYAHEVPLALREFRRVLKPEGFALIVLPDLQQVAQMVAEGKLEDTAYVSPAGPIAPIDMLYGLRTAMARGNLFMAHRTGFVARSLADALLAAGFAMVSVQRHPPSFNLYAIAFATAPDDGALKEAQRAFFPAPVA